MGELQIKSESVRSQAGYVKMRVSLYDNNSLVQQTVMGVDDYITMLQNSYRKDERPTVVDIGEIPDGFVDGVLSNKENTLGAIIYIPPQKHQFLLAKIGNEEKAAYYMPMPGLVYSCVVNKGARYSFRCFAFKEWNGKDTKLYQYPFGNVSNGGEICMGSVKSNNNLKSFMDIRECIEDSLNGITNADYLTDNKCRLSVDVTQHSFCKQNAEREEFPVELLLEHRIGTVKNLLDEFKKQVRTL